MTYAIQKLNSGSYAIGEVEYNEDGIVVSTGNVEIVLNEAQFNSWKSQRVNQATSLKERYEEMALEQDALLSSLNALTLPED